MSWGKPHPSMRNPLYLAIQGKHVLDLGAGDFTLSRYLLQHGAKFVTAVEPHNPSRYGPPVKAPPNFVHLPVYFDNDTLPDYIKTTNVEVAFLSWPANHHLPGLLPLLREIPTILYLGTNFNGTSCGHPALFKFFLTRELVAFVDRQPHNSMIILGERLPKGQRLPTPEEDAALAEDVIFSYKHRKNPEPED